MAFHACMHAKSLKSCLTLCNPTDGSPPGSASLGFSRQEHWSGLPFPSPEAWLYFLSNDFGFFAATQFPLCPSFAGPSLLLMTWIAAACPRTGRAGALYRFAFSPGERWNIRMCVFILWLMRPPLGRDGSLSKLLPEVLV